MAARKYKQYDVYISEDKTLPIIAEDFLVDSESNTITFSKDEKNIAIFILSNIKGFVRR